MGSKVCIFSGTKINFSRTKNNFSGTKNNISGTKINFSGTKIIFSATKIIFSPTNIIFSGTKIILVPLKIQTFEPNGTPYPCLISTCDTIFKILRLLRFKIATRCPNKNAKVRSDGIKASV